MDYDSEDCEMRVSISFCVNDAFVQHLVVVIASFSRNNPKTAFVFHVLHHDITDEHRDLLSAWHCDRDDCEIRFHEVDAAPFRAFPTPTATVTREMYYRYLLPVVLNDEDRTIYSDVDVICVGDVLPLWNLELSGNPLAAVANPKGAAHKARLRLSGPSPYFHSGLLVMDLAMMRKEDSASRLLENTARHEKMLAWPDMDIINITFHERILPLSSQWDGINPDYSPFRRDVAIWHFPGVVRKPWCNIWKNRSWPLYLKYLLRTPFRRMALPFIWGHIKGFFFFRYTKKGVDRYLVCGIRVWRKRCRVQKFEEA